MALVAKTPAISVIVPAHNAEATLGRTLEALAAQELSEPFEVIVVDDGSADATAAIVRRVDRFARLLQIKISGGPGNARNLGARASTAPVLAFTDADCFPTPKWLANGLRALTDADLVQGRVSPDPSVARSPFDRTLEVSRDGAFYQAANLLVWRETFEAVGGFVDWSLQGTPVGAHAGGRGTERSRRTPSGEDALFGWTARRLGARTAFCSHAVVHHAVVQRSVRDEVAERWHWTRQMPGLIRRVPELRQAAFYHHWFFHRRTARFDAAVVGLGLAILTRRLRWTAMGAAYAEWTVREAARWGWGQAPRFVFGSCLADTVTLAGLVVGSVRWRCVVV